MVSTLVDWLKDSGWLQFLTSSKATGPVTRLFPAFLTGKQVPKSKYCHQFKALNANAYDEAVQNGEAENDLSISIKTV